VSECDREALKMSRAKDVVPRGGGEVSYSFIEKINITPSVCTSLVG